MRRRAKWRGARRDLGFSCLMNSLTIASNILSYLIFALVVSGYAGHFRFPRLLARLAVFSAGKPMSLELPAGAIAKMSVVDTMDAGYREPGLRRLDLTRLPGPAQVERGDAVIWFDAENRRFFARRVFRRGGNLEPLVVVDLVPLGGRELELRPRFHLRMTPPSVVLLLVLLVATIGLRSPLPLLPAFLSSVIAVGVWASRRRRVPQLVGAVEAEVRRQVEALAGPSTVRVLSLEQAAAEPTAEGEARDRRRAT